MVVITVRQNKYHATANVTAKNKLTKVFLVLIKMAVISKPQSQPMQFIRRTD